MNHKITNFGLTLGTCLFLFITTIAFSADTPYDPTPNYKVFNIEGWTVRINQKLLNDKPDLAQKAKRVMQHQLYKVKRVVAPQQLKALQKVNIWMEVTDKIHPCACYHPDPAWLKANGYNPQKAKCVDIGNATNFINWTLDQPYMMLHELAHAYHHQVLGFNHKQIIETFNKAKANGKYNLVKKISGRTVKHYAITNHKEYFAELTESYLGTNDFFPYVREELKTFDPEGYKLMQQIWGPPPINRK